MVQKQAALSGGYRADAFADDDPLAELARIVGFEQPRVSHPSQPAPQEEPAESGFNLEDELLREFETFDSPVVSRLSAAVRAPEPIRAPEVVEPAPSPVPATVTPVSEPSRFEAGSARAEEPFDWAAELAGGEFADVSPRAERRVEPSPEPTFEAPRGEPDAFAQALEPVAVHQQHEDVFHHQAAPAWPQETVSRAEPPAPDFDFSADLADELEMGLGDAEPAAAYAVPAVAPAEPELAPVVQTPLAPAIESPRPALRGSQQSLQRVSLPLANFPAQPTFSRATPVAPTRFEAAPRVEDRPVALPDPVVAEPAKAAIQKATLWPETRPADTASRRSEPEFGDLDFSFAAELAASEAIEEPAEAFVTSEPVRSEPSFAGMTAARHAPDAAREVSAPATQPPFWAELELPDFASADTGRAAEPRFDGHAAEQADDVRQPLTAVAQRSEPPAFAPDFGKGIAAPITPAAPAAASFAAPSLASSAASAPLREVSQWSAPRAVAEPVSARASADRTAYSAPVFDETAAFDDDAVFEPDLLGDGEFELMLDELDLDLSDIDMSEPVAAVAPKPVPAPQPDPVSTRPAPAAPFISRATPRAEPAASEPVRSQARPVEPRQAAPSPFKPEEMPVAVAAARAVKAANPSAPVVLPFDLSEIVEPEDHPESVSMPDVPEVTHHEPEPAPPAKPEYEYDLEAELAGLFETPTPAPAPVQVGRARGKPAAAAPAAAGAAPVDDFDAFEKALEEDFRRSFDQGRKPTEITPARGGRIPQLTPADIAPARRGSWALVASVAVVALLLAGGGYIWLKGGSAPIVASGEPRIVTADKDPIKVAPENPGGKAVPNQDKAVYDRVAGAAGADPKQPSLISSNEEPMDVVQRTLMPENLPLEGEAEPEPGATPVGATPVGETEDPRLLPAARADAGTPAAPEAESGILPRKVRTMIVKPDGTLVAQEVDAPTALPAAPATSTTPAGLTTPTSQAAVLPPAATPSAPAPQAPTPQAAAVQAAAPQAQIAPAQAPAAATPAVAPAPVAATPEPNQIARVPAPVARPAEQPVNVVGAVTEQGNARTVQAAARPTAATPAAQPAPAATAAASSVPAGDYVIQIASLPSEAEAVKSYSNLSSKFGSVIGGRGHDIKAAEVPGKGTYYRVRIAAGSKAEADALCQRYKAAGGSCLVAR